MNDLKVKFHSLERLELTDINAIQDIAEAIRDDYAGNLFGAEGALTKLSFQEPILNNQIQFKDFAFLGKKEITSTGNLNRAFLGVYDASKSTDTFNIDASTNISLAQNYFNLNNNEPEIGGTGLAIHFPFIWVAAFNADSAVETRRVWSLSNAQEQTDSLETRVERRFKFKLGVTRPDKENLHTPYVKIGQIWKYAVSNGVVSIDEIRTYFVSEDLLGIGDVHPNTIINNSTYDSFKEYQGLKHTLHLIKDFLEKQLTNGSNDPANTTTKSLVEQPTYSLQGIAYKLDNAPTVKKASAHVTINVNYDAVSISNRVIVTVVNYTPSGVGASHPAFFPIEGVGIDYQDFYERNADYKTEWMNQTSAFRQISETQLDSDQHYGQRHDLKRWASVLTSWYIKIGSEYADALYSINLTPLYVGGSIAEVEKYDLTWHSDQLLAVVARPWDIVHSVKGFATGRVLGGAAPAAVLTQYKEADDTNTTFTGVYFKLTGLDDGKLPLDTGVNGSRSYLLNNRQGSSNVSGPAISGTKQFRFLIDMEIYQ